MFAAGHQQTSLVNIVVSNIKVISESDTQEEHRHHAGGRQIHRSKEGRGSGTDRLSGCRARDHKWRAMGLISLQPHQSELLLSAGL